MIFAHSVVHVCHTPSPWFTLTVTMALQTTKAKQKVTEQKIQQTEEAFSHAKQLYDEITDELYEELPAFYDR